MDVSDISIWLSPLVSLLNAVFVEGDAEPETCVVVMGISAVVIFALINFPQVKQQRADARSQSIRMIQQSQS